MSPFSRLFKRAKRSEGGTAEPNIDQGIHYLYLIVLLQVAFILGLLAVIMVIGKVMATPGWVFLVLMAGVVGAGVYLVRKTREQFRKLRNALHNAGGTGRNYQISVMGGVLTMRVEQDSRPLLEAPAVSPHTVIDAEPIDTKHCGSVS